MVDMFDFDEIRKDYDRWFAGDPYSILYINKCQYEVLISEIDKYKAQAEREHRRRVAAEEIALEIEMISDFELSDFNNIKSCRTNLMQIHEAAMKLKSIIKEAGE